MKRKPLMQLTLLMLMIFPLTSCVLDEDLDPYEMDPRDKFTGSWRVTETSGYKSTEGISYTITISYDPANSSQVLIRNFGNAGNAYSAFGIVTTGRITVPLQEIASGFLISGSGSSSGNTGMSWNYTITAGGDERTYQATAVKQ